MKTHDEITPVPHQPPHVPLVANCSIPYDVTRAQQVQDPSTLQFLLTLEHTRIGEPVALRRRDAHLQERRPPQAEQRRLESSNSTLLSRALELSYALAAVDDLPRERAIPRMAGMAVMGMAEHGSRGRCAA